MNHLRWMGHSSTIYDIHKNLRDDISTCEVTLMAKDHNVKAHRFVLSSCSDLLKSLLADIPIGQECTITIPDIKGQLLDNVLAFIYMGECTLSSTNLSEFLEAINVLGIKSAISFECNTTAMQAAQNAQNHSNHTISATTTAGGGTSSTMAVRHMAPATVTNVVLNQEELIEAPAVLHANTQTATNNVSSDGASRADLEFLGVYHEPQHKITYSIEQIPGATGGNEYILTENSGTFTLTQNHKMESTSSSASTNMEVNEDEACESHIIEEYSSGEEPLIHIGESTAEVTTNVIATQTANPTVATTTTSIIQMKPKIKTIKVKGQRATATAIIPKMEPQNDDMHTTEEAMSMLHSIHTNADENFSLLKDNSGNESANETGDFSMNSSELEAAELAYQAIVNEGMSLPKAAVKFNVSKSDLWRRVRSTGVDQLPKSPKLDTEKLDVIELASQAVINEGLSLQKAAVRYDISKTVLWRRVRKHPQYMKTARENPIISKAYERLKTGEPLKNISQDLDIPMSTLHRHKVRLSLAGQLPDFVTCRKRDSLSKDDLKMKLAKAVHACVHDGMSQNHAANLYEVSKSTLWRHLQRRVAEAEAAQTSEGAVEESMEEDGEEEIKEEIILS